MSTPEQQRRATEFLERLLADPELRADFRRRPATTCRAHDLPELADELDLDVRGSATLEQRESRSGMAGVMIAAAAEGLGLVELIVRHAGQAGEASAATASQLVERVSGGGRHAAASAAREMTSDAAAPEAAGAITGPAAPQPSAIAPDPTAPPASTPISYASADPAGLPVAGAPPAAAPMTASAAAVAPVGDPAGLPPATAAAPPAVTAAAAGGAPAKTGGLAPAAAPTTPHGPPAADSPDAPADAPEQSRRVPAAAPAELYDVPRDYPGDGAPKSQLAAWMGKRAAAAGLPRELPVMASLVESGLANLGHGDRDSVGFFQMRVGIWNEGAYRGYPENPDLQLQWFLDRAVAVKARHIAAGDAGFGHDPHGWGEWVADVENPDRRYRGRYQEQLDAAHGLLGASAAPAATAAAPAAGASAAAPAPVSAAALAADVQAVAPGAAMASAADRAVELAKAYLGDAYVWGGASPQTGFDCSGLVQYVYHQVGIELPRVTDQQFATGQVVGRDELRTGDVVFFRDATGYVHHEGLYLSDGRFLHAPSTGDVVKVSSLDEPYFAQQFAGARRMSASAPAIAESIDMTRRSAGHVAALRPHDARVLPVIDPAAPRPAG